MDQRPGGTCNNNTFNTWHAQRQCHIRAPVALLVVVVVALHITNVNSSYVQPHGVVPPATVAAIASTHASHARGGDDGDDGHAEGMLRGQAERHRRRAFGEGLQTEGPIKPAAPGTGVHARAYRAPPTRRLLRGGGDPKLRPRDGSGWSDIHYAARDATEAHVRQLLDDGFDPDLVDGARQTPLHVAAQAGNEGAAVALLDAGARVEVTDTDGWTPMHVAADSGHVAVMRRLLLTAMDRNKAVQTIHAYTTDRAHMTPLHLAAKGGHHEIVAALLRFGAKNSALDGWGRSPEDLAFGWVWNHDPVLKAFADHRARVRNGEL